MMLNTHILYGVRIMDILLKMLSFELFSFLYSTTQTSLSRRTLGSVHNKRHITPQDGSVSIVIMLHNG